MSPLGTGHADGGYWAASGLVPNVYRPAVADFLVCGLFVSRCSPQIVNNNDFHAHRALFIS